MAGAIHDDRLLCTECSKLLQRRCPMRTSDLQELAARITAPMTTTAADVLLEIVPPTLDLLARGKPASLEEIAAASSGKSPEDVRGALGQFPSAEWDELGRVVGLGLTLRLTPHRLELEGHTLFARCALDALLFPVLLRRSASIESPCRGTGEPVRVDVTPDGIEAVEPPSAVVSIVAARVWATSAAWAAITRTSSALLRRHPDGLRSIRRRVSCPWRMRSGWGD
jgi:Alkylmercury lyase/Helix-turn-helix domain of alkylmercury lyase